MRKNRLLLCIALMLVFAMSLAMFVACADDQTEQPVDPGTTDTPGTDTDGPTGDISIGGGSTVVDGDTVTVNGLSAQKEFVINGGVTDFAVFVETTSGRQPVSDYEYYAGADNKGVVYLYSPSTGWPKSGVVVIELYNGAYLEDYPDAKVLKFTVARESNGVQVIDGIRVYDAARANVKVTNTDEYGDTYGSVTLMGMSRGFEKDEVFILENEDGTQAAFKALDDAAPTAGVVTVNFIKPELTEVFEKFDVNTTTALNEDSMIVIEENLEEQLNNSEIGLAAIDIFQSAPEFGVNVDLVDGVLKVDITITVPNVVAINGQANSDLVINLHNDMTVNLNADIDIDTISEDFDISADIKNDMTATVTLGANANVSQIANVQDLFSKLVALANSSNENPTAISLFKWTLPIGNGVASISYDADLVFAFNFSGKIGVEAQATLDYTVGAKYSEETGIEMYSEESEDNGFHDLTVDLYGMAELKVGIDQRVSFDILAGVLGIGLQAELGNYNRIYGYGVTTDLINDEEDAMNGGFYFVGGFYYDVNLTYGLKIGSLLNISDKADIVSGEVELYDPIGDRYVEVGLVQTADAVALTAKQSLVPAIYEVVLFDLVTQTESTAPIDASELVFTGADGLTFTSGVVNVNEGENDVNTVVTVKYGNFDSVKTTYTFSAAKPMLDVDNGTVDKSSEDITDKVVTITYDGITKEMISVSDNVVVKSIVVEGNEAVVTLDGKELLKLETGVQNVVFTVDGYELTYALALENTVSATQFREGNTYTIFTADQVKDLANHGTYDDMTLVITDDIDLGGATIAPIANFEGTIEGSNKTISGYVIDSMSGNNAAFIAVNNGEVRNLTLDGTVKVAFDGKTGNDYKVAGLAAVNNGTIKNVTVKGVVDVESNSLSAFIDIDAAMVAATGNEPVDATAEGTVDVTVAFDLANVTVNAGGLTSTAAADGVTVSVDCVNGRSNPIFTKVNIA